VAGDLPSKQGVFHFRTLADVMNDKIISAGSGLSVYHHPNVRDIAAKIPRNEIARQIIITIRRWWQSFTFTTEEDHQVGDTAVIDVCVCVRQSPARLIRVACEIRLHVVVNFFLQVNADGAIDADDLVGANTGVGGDVSIGIRYTNVGRILTNRVVGPFDGDGHQFLRESDTFGISGVIGKQT